MNAILQQRKEMKIFEKNLENKIKSHNLRMTEYLILLSLTELEIANMREIAKYIFTHESTVFINANNLSEKGLVKLFKHFDDSRYTYIEFTEDGKKFYSKIE